MARQLVATLSSFAFIQTKQNSTAGAGSLLITLNAPATINNLLIIHVKTGNNVPTSVTDDKGNVYLLAGGPTADPGTTFRYTQYYGVQLIGGATQITVNFTGTPSARITVDEFSGNSNCSFMSSLI